MGGKANRVVVPARETDDWFTPVNLFAGLHARLRFSLDVAAHPKSPVTNCLPRAFTVADDGLVQSWSGERVWCNPPYSNPGPWVSKADLEMRAGCELVVMLLPATKTEQPWWGQFVECRRDGRSWGLDPFTLTSTFLPKRVRFGFPQDPSGESGHYSRFGVVLLEWQRVRGRRLREGSGDDGSRR